MSGSVRNLGTTNCDAVARAMARRGLKVGERIGILSNTRRILSFTISS